MNDEYLFLITDNVYPHSPGNYRGEIYTYNNGKLELAYDSTSFSTEATVTNNVILDEHFRDFPSIGYTAWDMAYKLTNGTWQQMWESSQLNNSFTYIDPKTNEEVNINLNGGFTLLKKLKLYKNPGSSEVAYTAKKGEKLVVWEICEKNGKYYIGAYYKEQLCWFEEANDFNEDLWGYFKEAEFRHAG